MKKLLIASLLITSACAFAESKDPTPYADYTLAMDHMDGYQMAVEWHNAVGDKLNAAVDARVLAAFVKDEASARALLAQVKGAYDTDPQVATQIGAVSQWVMDDDDVAWYDFWSDTPRADGRKVWVQALVARAETAQDTYVQLFCLDQLRWCGCSCPCLLKRIEAIGAASNDKHVKEMTDIVLRTLK